MVLESTVICVDNSEYMRNGDFVPTRMQAQHDAVQLVCNAKTRSNPESNIALMSLAAKENLQVHSTFTTDVNRILSLLTQIQPNGDFKLLTGIKIAQLVLRHRQGKNHRQRIVVFVGSPVEESERELVMVAKKLRKNNVNVNIVNFGEEENVEKLQTFVSTLNQDREEPGSHFVNVPSGSKLSDALLQSPVITEDGGAAAGGGGFDGAGLDPNDDPELALALRVSMEEQRKAQQEAAGGGTEGGEMDTAPAVPVQSAGGAAADSEEALLQQALSLSMGGVPIEKDLSQMTEDEQIELALRMSMQPEASTAEDSGKAAGGSKPKDEAMDTSGGASAGGAEEEVDAEQLRAILESLPGVDPNDPQIREMIEKQAKEDAAKKKP